MLNEALLVAEKFELKKSQNSEYLFNLKAGNGEVILTSETYVTKDSALAGIASVRVNSPIDERYERKMARNGQPYFILKAANGLVLGTSEFYANETAMSYGIASVKRNAPEARLDDQTGT